MLERIKKNGDIRRLSPDQYESLAKEIRTFLIQKISKSGGHLASNLGVVELTMALHLVFDFSRDRVIWDVGHQSYVHKILTGRADSFDSLRQLGGLSGFPKREESETDCFDTGHSSVSVSAGLGMVAARDLLGEDYSVVSVIGDGAATGGMFYEALNNAGRLNTNFIIVLNDNEMSIAPNVSGMSSYLSSLRTATSYNDLKSKVKSRLSRMPMVGDSMVRGISQVKDGIKQLFIPEMLFENLGITYLGPIDGHNIGQMTETFRHARKLKKAVVIHVVTQKGRGYRPAASRPDHFHGVGPFDIRTGQSSPGSARTWTDVFSAALLEEAEKNKRILAITAAMPDGTGLKQFGQTYPDRFFDVGIAEEHAVTFAAGLAIGGMVPVVAIYSTFLQRSYDQIIQDVCLQKLHVVFAVDRSGLVGQDGQTHQGIFDAGYLQQVPNMTVLTPGDASDLKAALHYAICEARGPVAVCYGRGSAPDLERIRPCPMETGRSELLYEGEAYTIFATGNMVSEACRVRVLLEEKGISGRVVNTRFLKPMDESLLVESAQRGPVVFLEETLRIGSFGQRAEAFLAEKLPGARLLSVAIEDRFVEQGVPDQLKAELGLDAASVADRILFLLEGEK